MSTASLVCLCLVLVAVAAKDCGEQGCAAEDDSAALLQAAVSVGAVQSGEDVTLEESGWVLATLEESGNTQALLSPRAGKNSKCKMKGGVLRTYEECGTTKDCSWDGSECASGCRTFKSEGSCPTDYCVWYGKQVSVNKKTHCGDKLDYVNLGGSRSHNFDGASSQRAMVGNKRKPMAGLRPQLSTKWRSKDGTSWTACAGSTNCWHGGGSRATDADLRVALGSPYFKARVDVLINCEWNGKMRIAFEKLSHAHFSVWYNDKKRADSGDSSTWDHRRWNGGLKHIAFTRDDASPILRMELSKLTSAQQAPAYVKAKLYIMNVPIWFEKCMDTKATHGQCLKEFVGGNYPLRSDHKLQCACIQKCASGTCPSIGACQEWNGCMSHISKELIVRVIQSFDPTACAAPALLQTDSAAAPALLQQNATSTWTGAAGGCDDDATTCSDPSKIDVESFDCTCYDYVIDSTDPANPVLRPPEEIRKVACPSQQSHICCSWKNAVGCPNAPVLLQTGEAATLHEKTMTHRSEQAALAEGGSLDDSLAGKRCTA